ncbi:hypothetical protein BUALT_Bualt13G0102100 [Buddleja alternifolia]|uniref:Uncharacterized protein n=1 Tax=Buddleja alternifolia TaxID=168488 RepID=A0AAV6WNB4_9LAMI|nr:hypothetical protein BUALT_Bualt13G0102100 [Buddleja alternifolia]
MFDLSKKEAEELSGIHKRDIIDWYKTYLRQPSSKCRRLAIRVWGCNTDMKDADAQATPLQVIKDLQGFQEQIPILSEPMLRKTSFLDTSHHSFRVGKEFMLGKLERY